MYQACVSFSGIKQTKKLCWTFSHWEKEAKMKKKCLSKTQDYYNGSFILKWTCLSRKIKRMIYRMVSGCVFPKCLEPTPSFTLSLGQCCTAKAFLVMTFLFVNFPQTLLSFICPFTLRQLHCNTALQQLLQNSIFWIQIS